jgi:ribosomal protein S18 acetylase RimI-like enzyme
MLVVKPARRGHGIGRLLTEECIHRARRDNSSIIALHTTPIMTVALAMYLRMGFAKLRDAPDIYGVPYGVYTKTLA